jgi:outer membrane protein assembly factor BamA
MLDVSRFLFILMIVPLLCLCICKNVQGQEIQELFIIESIEITGNNITKEKIILREIEFQPGDTIAAHILPEIIKQTSNNLMNMSIFHFVDIDYETISADEQGQFLRISIHIRCTERWYLWPIPYASFEERNVNDWLERRDLSRFSWGAALFLENFRGRKETLSLGFKTGFNDMVVLKYVNPSIDKSLSTGLSATFNFTRERNIFYLTEENKIQVLKLDDDYAVWNRYVNISLSKRFGIHQTFRVYGQYNHYTFSDTLFALNPLFSEPNLSQLKFFTLSLWYKYDFRDYIHYPLEGFFFDCELTKQGLGIISNNNFSDMNLKSSYRTYRKLADRFYFAGGIAARIRLDDNRSYLFGRGLGFGNDYVRGFEQYVIDGRNYVLFKSNFKYNIIKPGILKLNFLRSEKFNTIPYRFYLNIFADAGYISDRQNEAINPLANRLLTGFGLGIDFVTYYDRAYRVEISRNSKNEFSFAIQFTSPL